MKGFGKFPLRRKKAEKSPVAGAAKFQDSDDANEVSLVVDWCDNHEGVRVYKEALVYQ